MQAKLSQWYQYNERLAVVVFECLAKNGKAHDKLPKKLLDYMREPGSKRGSREACDGRSGEE